MISHKTQSFRVAFRRLPEQVRQQAHHAFKLFRQDPYHKSLHFKSLQGEMGDSVRRPFPHFPYISSSLGRQPLAP
jgi:hypothetical protein